MNKMKRILLILHFPPPVHGSSMVGQMIKNSQLINSSFDCRYINLLVSRNIIETRKFSFLKFFRFIGVCLKLFIEITLRRPDVCYLALSLTGLSFYKDVLLVVWLRLFHVKKIYHLHNKGVSQNQTKKIYRLLYHFVFKDADVILLSNRLYKDIETFVPLSKVHICPNGIEDLALNYKPKLSTLIKPVKILFLSNLIDSKGVTVLLEACLILLNNGIDIECDFVGAEGDMSIAQFEEKVTQHGMDKKVKYLGMKFGYEKQDILMNADIFALPTFYSNECFPLTILEAMSSRLPVISTFEGGIPDIIEDRVTGFLVPQKNVETLAAKLKMLIQNSKLRHRLGIAGRQKFEMEFTVDIFERNLKSILQQIVTNT